MKGFTLLEMMMAIMIASILSLFGIHGYQKMVADMKFKQALTGLSAQIQNAKTIAFKYDCNVLVKFAPTCSVFVDKNNNGTVETGDILVGTYKLPSTVSFGVSGAASGPTGVQFLSSGITSGWTPLVVSNSLVRSFGNGAVYLKCSQLSNITYCICSYTPSLVIKTFKWSKTWSSL
jgi:prepilin-type N-terminal cleavage/methylation domain-containing protein